MSPYQRWQLEKYGNVLTEQGELYTHEEAEQIQQDKELEQLNDYFEPKNDQDESGN